ncbi:MAG: RHS repeat domain-containing protein, partial [Myxococcota bacterium]|nr:RHS repeat domain-containing protein [Myxococcota bacterium]
IEQEFRGFGAADAVTVGDWNNPTVYSRTHFLQGRRPHSIADDRLAENPYEALKGREVRTEVFDEAGVFLSTSFATITNRLLYTGLNGVPVYYAFVNETNELRYDTTIFGPSATMTVPAIVGERLRPDGTVLSEGTLESLVVPIRNGHEPARIMTKFDVVDALGHVRQQTAHGRVDPVTGADIDEHLTSYTTPILVDDEAWIWRTARSFMRGEGTTEPNFGETVSTYDEDTGDLLTSTQIVDDGAPVYAFGGDPAGEGGAMGFDGADAAAVHADLVASTHYDAWGNAIRSCAGSASVPGDELVGAPGVADVPASCLRFGWVVYDSPFAQLAEDEYLAIDRVASPHPNQNDWRLHYHGDWDRGLGAITGSTDPNGLETDVTYDGLGRLTSVTPPDHETCTNAPTTRIQYELTASPASQPVSQVTSTTFLDCGAGADTLQSIAYVDGLGRARASLATGDSATEWLRGGIATFDKKGTVRRTYQPDVFNGSLTDLRAIVALPPAIPYAVTRYDAFGRAKGVITEDGAVTWTSYHSRSTDVCDPLDNDPSSPHYRTCTTAYTDGHGRVIDQILRNRNPDTGANEVYRLWSYYRPDGAVEALVRAESTSGAARPSTPGAATGQHVERTFVYDSVGRRLSSDDPDSDNLDDPSDASNSWRYLFNRVGDLVAVRDPRGCGQNFFYDLGGRLRGEQYVSCIEAQSAEAEQPHGDNSVGHLTALDYSAAAVTLDVVYHYDTYPSWDGVNTGTSLVPPGSSGTLGLATGVSDRAQRAVLAYDDRGNVTWTARQLALISAPIALGGQVVVDGRPVETEQPALAGTVEYDDTHTYTRTSTFDPANRPTSMTLPRDPDYHATETAPLVSGSLTYNRRGLPASATAVVGGASHPVVSSIAYLRDGLVSAITYGDDLMGARTPTTSTTTYDVRRRPVRMRPTRDATGLGGAGQELEAVTTVVDQELIWDAANNLTATVDHRDGAEWPAGFRPQTTFISHDALYRVVGADFEYTQPGGARTMSDVGTDWRANYTEAPSVDPMRQTPAPAVVDVEGIGRVETLRWSWDYLANTTSWTDNDDAFYERSIGAIGNGNAAGESSGSRPSALYVASNLTAGVTGSSNGWVEVDYGVGGNVTGMTVHAQCADGVSTC